VGANRPRGKGWGPITPEAEFLVEKPGTKTGLLPGFFVFSSRHLLSGNARYFWSFALFSSLFLQFVSFSSCFEEGTRVSFCEKWLLFPGL
jgi:hypothetical protein